MHVPALAAVLGVQPAGAWEWLAAGAGALVLAGAVDLEKAIRRARPDAARSGGGEVAS
jgi:hypothetical protein